MAFLAAALPYIGAGVTAYSAVRQGEQAKYAADLEAKQMEANAMAETATAQRSAARERRYTMQAQSRLQAVSASSGAGSFDPTVVNISGDIQKEGELRVLNALYSGTAAADGLNFAAEIRKKEGSSAQSAGTINAVSSIVSSGSSIAARYQ